MKKLFLSSYFAGVAKLLPDFIGTSCDGLNCVFIPTASNVEKVTFYIGTDKKALEKLRINIDELDISKAPKETIKTKIANADIIFVEGGNTFFLLQELKRTGTDKLIIEHINKGKPYIGASAGSMIVSKDIEYVKHMDNPDAAKDLHNDFLALSLVDFCIVPHCNNFPFKKAAAKIISEYSETLDLRPIHNAQVVIVKDDKNETLTFEKNKKCK
jgi:dipeptidase E